MATSKHTGHSRFSLARLMIAIAVFAFGFLILRQSRGGRLSVSLVAWWFGLLLLVFSSGRTQAFWAGFVLFGWLRPILFLPFYDRHHDFLIGLHAGIMKWLGPSIVPWHVAWEVIDLLEFLPFAVVGGLVIRWYYMKKIGTPQPSSENPGGEARNATN